MDRSYLGGLADVGLRKIIKQVYPLLLNRPKEGPGLKVISEQNNKGNKPHGCLIAIKEAMGKINFCRGHGAYGFRQKCCAIDRPVKKRHL